MNLYALDAVTGSKVWLAHVLSQSPSESSPAVANGVVYMGAGDGALFAFDTASGGLLWGSPTGSSGDPAVADGTVYGGSWDEHVYAFRLPRVRPRG